MDYLKRESALILNQTCVTFYFLVRNLTSLKNTNTINTSFSLCKDFYVEHRGCTEWLKLINQLILLKLTLLLEKSKMAKILKILKISKIFKNYHLEPFHIVAHLCNTLFIILCFPPTIDLFPDISEYHQYSKHHFYPHRSLVYPLACTVRPRCERVLCDLFMLRHTAESKLTSPNIKNLT